MTGIDVDIRAHDCAAIAAPPMVLIIQMFQGSSIVLNIIEQVKT